MFMQTMQRFDGLDAKEWLQLLIARPRNQLARVETSIAVAHEIEHLWAERVINFVEQRAQQFAAPFSVCCGDLRNHAHLRCLLPPGQLGKQLAHQLIGLNPAQWSGGEGHFGWRSRAQHVAKLTYYRLARSF